MVVPALIYFNFNFRGLGAHRLGPSDGNRHSIRFGRTQFDCSTCANRAKVLLTALAIVDDMGSVLVISLFYSEAIVWSALGGAAATLLVLIGFNLYRYPASLAVPCWSESSYGVLFMPPVSMLRLQELLSRSRFLHAHESTRGNSRAKHARCWKVPSHRNGDFAVLSSKGQQETVLCA
jgi:hypothetical protein